eukprot:699948-Pelagomonas_calceolata.AAC.4
MGFQQWKMERPDEKVVPDAQAHESLAVPLCSALISTSLAVSCAQAVLLRSGYDPILRHRVLPGSAPPMRSIDVHFPQPPKPCKPLSYHTKFTQNAEFDTLLLSCKISVRHITNLGAHIT